MFGSDKKPQYFLLANVSDTKNQSLVYGEIVKHI